MAKITVDKENAVGRIKPMHGVGQPPFIGHDFHRLQWLTDAGIPFSRLHDVGGAYGGNRYVDIPNLFRDFSADPEDPASYDFAFTDLLIKEIVGHGVEPFFRLGVTIENDMEIKAYRIAPPADPHKWAKICEMVIRHYTEGWAGGFRYDIRYWEIWNEPENHVDPAKNQMWTGTKEQYYELYNITASHLKKCFPHLKIGGYASCGFYAMSGGDARSRYFIDFFDGFLASVKENGSPLDFFSWHSYDGIENTVKYAAYCRRRLDEAGFTETETTCNEWDPENYRRGTDRHAALICGMMLAMQHTSLDSAMFYDARFGLSVYGALFDPMNDCTYPAYDAFLAFNELYKRGDELAVTVDAPNVYAAAAKGKDDICVVVSNTNDTYVPLDLDVGEVVSCRMTGWGKRFEEVPLPENLPSNSLICVIYKA